METMLIGALILIKILGAFVGGMWSVGWVVNQLSGNPTNSFYNNLSVGARWMMWTWLAAIICYLFGMIYLL